MKKKFLLLLLATALTVTTLSTSSCLKNDPPPKAPTETQTGGEYESDKPYLPEADVNIAKYKLEKYSVGGDSFGTIDSADDEEADEN